MTRTPHQLAWLWYLLGALGLLLVAILSLIPLLHENLGMNDKLSHLLTYALLSGWFSLLVRSQFALVWVAVGLVSFGVGIEWLQSLTDYRLAEWTDVIANSIGVLLGACLYFTPAVNLMNRVDRRLGALLLSR